MRASGKALKMVNLGVLEELDRLGAHQRLTAGLMLLLGMSAGGPLNSLFYIFMAPDA